jgi:hypothetical protein
VKSSEKNTEPARPMANSASPETDAACVRAKRVNGDGAHGRRGSRPAGAGPRGRLPLGDVDSGFTLAMLRGGCDATARFAQPQRFGTSNL